MKNQFTLSTHFEGISFSHFVFVFWMLEYGFICTTTYYIYGRIRRAHERSCKQTYIHKYIFKWFRLLEKWWVCATIVITETENHKLHATQQKGNDPISRGILPKWKCSNCFACYACGCVCVCQQTGVGVEKWTWIVKWIGFSRSLKT